MPRGELRGEKVQKAGVYVSRWPVHFAETNTTLQIKNFSKFKNTSSPKRQGRNLSACYQVKEASLKGYTLYDFNNITVWRRQNYGGSKRLSGCQVPGWRQVD